jgi:hypothetical protein
MHARRTTRRASRRLNRTTIRSLWRAPNDLAFALTASRRAIRAHRRLAKLAPHEYDYAVVNRDCLERERERRRRARWEPAIEKAYGPPTPAEREARLQAELRACQPPCLAPAVQRQVEIERVNWEFWMAAADMAWDRFQQRRPHALVNLGRIARILDIATEMGRLASGFDPNLAGFKLDDDDAEFEAAIKRAYPEPPAPPSQPPPEQFQPPAANPPADLAPAPPATCLLSPVSCLQSLSPSPSPAPPRPRRCDAYTRLARQLNRRAQ